MKKEIKNILIGVLVLFIYFFSNIIITSIFNYIGININNLSDSKKILYNLFYELILIIIFIFIYRKKIINDFNNFKNIHFIEYIRYLLIAIGLMSISSILINMFTNISTSSNQEMIMDTFTKYPIYIIILAIIFAPILEELVFRLSLKKIFSNNKLFIVISGLFFGFMHVISANSILELLYIIPYSIPGFIFAYTFVKSDNILVPIGLHFIHNFSMIVIQSII